MSPYLRNENRKKMKILSILITATFMKLWAFSSSFTDSIRKTQCAHIVWYAYHKFDFELLKNDKLIVLPYDLASSEEVEVVQTFGFDPNVLWDSLYK